MRIIIYIIMSLLPTFASAWEVHDLGDNKYAFGNHDKMVYIYRPMELAPKHTGSEGEPAITHIKPASQYANGQGYVIPNTEDTLSFNGIEYPHVLPYSRHNDADLGVNFGCFLLYAGDYVIFEDTVAAGGASIQVSETSCKGAEYTVPLAANACSALKVSFDPTKLLFAYENAFTAYALQLQYTIEYTMSGFTTFKMTDSLESNIPEIDLEVGGNIHTNLSDGNFVSTFHDLRVRSNTGEKLSDIMFRYPDTNLIRLKFHGECL